MKFSNEETELLFSLTESLTGTCQKGVFRKDILLSNIHKRMQDLKCSNLVSYLKIVERDPKEYSHFVSNLTIHTTSWFRELPHMQILEELLPNFRNKKLKLLSLACSTGEEVYTLGLILENFRRLNPSFDYFCHGRDIDPVSVSRAQKAIYSSEALPSIQETYQRDLLVGTGQANGFFTLSKEIRSRCEFKVLDLRDIPNLSESNFDFIFCRNALIYFDADTVKKIVSSMTDKLTKGGHLVLGHSENITAKDFNLVSVRNSVYKKLECAPAKKAGATLTSSKISDTKTKTEILPKANSKKTILVIDDSKTIQSILTKVFSQQNFDVVCVNSAQEANDKLQHLHPDLITLDLHMPVVSGQEWLNQYRIRNRQTPVVVISDAGAHTALPILGALENGAQDYIEKELLFSDKREVVERVEELIYASTTKTKTKDNQQHKSTSAIKNGDLNFYPDLITIGASTGGTQALTALLKNFSTNSPPVIVVQHISPDFLKVFAGRLAETSNLILGSNEVDAPLKRGHLYMAHDDYQIGVKQKNNALVFFSQRGDKVSGHRPSVDFMFESIASLKKVSVAAALLTGMGADGAKGLLKLKDNGAYTMAQNEESCVVFGMPKKAIELNAALMVGDLGQIRAQFDQGISKKH